MFNGIADDAVPEVTAIPFTLTVAPTCVTLGFTITEAVVSGTRTEYRVVALAKAGVSGPPITCSPESVATDDGRRVTVIIDVLVLTASCAVTTILIGFGPTASIIGPDATPEATAMLFIFKVAVGSWVTAVTVTVAVALLSVAV